MRKQQVSLAQAFTAQPTGMACSKMNDCNNTEWGAPYMRGSVTVAFAPDREFELRIPEREQSPQSAEEANQWLSQQWEEFDCTPRSLVGKVLTMDKILEVAREAGEKRFADEGAWAEHYARAVLAVLDRDNVRVDVAENTVG
jgi:hypothetical protein